MNLSRIEQLKKNFNRLFIIRALLNVRIIGIVGSLFFISRGVTFGQMTFLSVIFALVGLISEVPSSYLADKWGRKKTIIAGTIVMLFHWVFMLIADTYVHFIISTIMYGFMYSLFTGTDEALIYDTNKELGGEANSLTKLGNYFSARSLIRIFGILLGTFIAKDLMDWQFNLILSIDLACNVIALFFAFRLTEANHYMDVSKSEAGVFKDAWKLLSANKHLTLGMISKGIFFTSTILIFNYADAFFVGLGLSVLALGIIVSLRSILDFTLSQKIKHLFPQANIVDKIKITNILTILGYIVFLTFYYIFPNPYLLFVVYNLIILAVIIQEVFFSEYFNKHSHSYNRATTISLSNLVRHLLELPIISLSAYLVSINLIYPYFLALLIVVIAFALIRLPKYEAINHA